MIHHIPRGHRSGLLLRDTIESRIGRHFPFAVLMAKARNQLCGRCGLRAEGREDGEQDGRHERRAIAQMSLACGGKAWVP